MVKVIGDRLTALGFIVIPAMALAVGLAWASVRLNLGLAAVGDPLWPAVAQGVLRAGWPTLLALTLIRAGRAAWIEASAAVGDARVASAGLVRRVGAAALLALGVTRPAQSVGDVLTRALLVVAAGLPRYVMVDPMGGAVASLWIVAITVVLDGVLAAYAPRWRRWLWLAAVLLVLPWGIPALSTTWPEPKIWWR